MSKLVRTKILTEAIEEKVEEQVQLSEAVSEKATPHMVDIYQVVRILEPYVKGDTQREEILNDWYLANETEENSYTQYSTDCAVSLESIDADGIIAKIIPEQYIDIVEEKIASLPDPVKAYNDELKEDFKLDISNLREALDEFSLGSSNKFTFYSAYVKDRLEELYNQLTQVTPDEAINPQISVEKPIEPSEVDTVIPEEPLETEIDNEGI